MSLPDDDIAFLDTYAAQQGIESRSAVLHKAVRLLRATELAEDYASAWAEWDAGPDAAVWAATTNDGV